MLAWSQINDKARNTLGWMLRLIILVGCGWFIAQAVWEKWPLEVHISTDQWKVILVVFVLSGLNWALEVGRWKFSLDQIGKTSWQSSARQVFSGLALNWIVPFTGGDLMARLLPHADKKNVVTLVFYNRSVMLIITLLFGMYGVYVYSERTFESGLWTVPTLILVILVIGWLLKRFINRDGPGSRWVLQLTVLSMIRYAVFVGQFYLLLQAFISDQSVELLLGGVGWIFLFRSVIPSLFGNLGVREASALVFFDGHVSDPMMVLTASLFIWLINTILPSLIGLYFIIRFPVKIAA